MKLLISGILIILLAPRVWADGYSVDLHLDGPNTVKAGAIVPLKWSMSSNDGTVVNTLDAVLGLESQRVVCNNETFDNEEPAPLSIAGNSVLRYDNKKEQYVFAWRTSKQMKNQCYTLILSLDDFSQHFVRYEFN
jgi:hypothetical protein